MKKNSIEGETKPISKTKVKSKLKAKESSKKLKVKSSLVKAPTKVSQDFLPSKPEVVAVLESDQIVDAPHQPASQSSDYLTLVKSVAEAKSVKKEPKNLVERAQVEKAIASLRKWLEGQKKEKKNQLLDGGDMFYVVLSSHKIPEQVKINGIRISIPHSLYPLNSGYEICMLINDSNEEKYKKLKKEINDVSTYGISKVIGVKKLKANYRPYEAKRNLCGSYDLFLSDDRIISILPKLLGKNFFKFKKHPIPVKLNKGLMRNRIRAAIDSTYMYINGGNCSTIRAARVTQSDEEAVDNIMAVIAGAVDAIPKQWKNVRSIYIKTLESLSLPVFVSLPTFPSKIPPVGKK